jgi:hypothetical protein
MGPRLQRPRLQDFFEQRNASDTQIGERGRVVKDPSVLLGAVQIEAKETGFASCEELSALRFDVFGFDCSEWLSFKHDDLRECSAFWQRAFPCSV